MTSPQWAEMLPGLIIVATADRAWLHRPQAGGIGDPFSQPMTASPTVSATCMLLDGAMAAGRKAAPSGAAGMPLTPLRWAWRLAWQYHTAHATPAVLAEAQSRFASRPEIANFCALKIEEETGHDELALMDLRALGYHAEAVVAAVRQPTVIALVDYFRNCVRSDSPMSFIGYAYALERGVMAIGSEYVQAVEALLPPGVRATRCLRVHSSLGSDASHVMEAVEFIASLSPEDRATVAKACYETVRIQHTPRVGDDPPEEELERILSPLKTH